uniref:RRM domain-containing protein n=1 Tax=Panagrolaimus sp. PS1159 TaxID=55785 RepID=A0AC35FXF4_9BILA
MTSSSTPTNPTGIIHHQQQPSPILSSTGVTATGNSLFPGLVDPTIAKRQRLAASAFAATQAQAVAAQVAALQQAAAIAQQQQHQHQAFMSNAGMLAGVPVSSSAALQHALWAGKIAQMSHSHKHETKISEPQMSNLLILGQNASNATTGTSNSSTPGQQQQQQSSGTTRERDTSSTASQLDISTQQQPNAVLRVIIDSMIYPVTLDVLHSIFSRYGKVLRIITFNKNNTFQALVQLSEANAAQQARQALDGQNVYNNCCTLRIDYSKLSTLNVKYNNDKSRDYTNPTLPSGELSLEQQLSLISAAAGQNQVASNPLSAMVPNGFSFLQSGNQLAFAQQALSGDGLSVSQSLAPFLGQLGGGLGNTAGITGTNNLSGATPTVAGIPFSPINILGITPVVLVSNLNEQKITPDALFTLFGVYGDVQRVKILFNKKDNALIQFAEPQQAQHSIQHLDKVRWQDRVIRVTASKHSNVQMPKEGQPDAGLTRDYTNSSLHRFKKPGSKNYMNIYPPSNTLHLSNIPPNTSEDFLKKAFEDKKFNIVEFKFFQRDHKMALVQLPDAEQAINALIELHNYKLADNAHLRVSFSKKGITI